MLDLDTGVHLYEIMPAVPVYQELQRAGVDIAHMLCDFHCILMEGFPDGLRHRPGGSELNDLLVSALQRAVALEQVDEVAVFVAQDLDFDVLRLHQELFHEDVVVAEGLFRLGFDKIVIDADLFHRVAAAHASSAAAGSRFQNDGETELEGQFLRLFLALQGLCGTGDRGHAALLRQMFGGELVAHHVKYRGGGADEFDAGSFAGARKVSVLAQKAVTGMDGIRVVLLRDLDDAGNVEIGTERCFVLADQIRFVSGGSETAVKVLLGVYGHGPDLQVVAGAEDTHGDLAAIGDQYFLELRHESSSSSSILLCGMTQRVRPQITTHINIQQKAAAWQLKKHG